jgi:hypothetical protein
VRDVTVDLETHLTEEIEIEISEDVVVMVMILVAVVAVIEAVTATLEEEDAILIERAVIDEVVIDEAMIGVQDWLLQSGETSPSSLRWSRTSTHSPTLTSSHSLPLKSLLGATNTTCPSLVATAPTPF